MSTLPSFELHGPLPSGRMAIEASAGTGKTHALATLAARYVAEAGVPVGELLIVTFTRAAAAELRDRVRARLVHHLSLLRRDTLTDEQARDAVDAVVWSDDPAVRGERARRVEAAIGDFDSATITTIHGFAQQVLGTLGATVGTDPDATLVDDAAEMVRQVATDLWVREAIEGDIAVLPKLDDFCATAADVLGNPAAHLVPEPGDESAGPVALATRRLIDDLRAEIGHRRRAAGTMAFDDLLVRLRDAVRSEEYGEVARSAIRQRFRVALIDEFQDTDPVQWEIFDAVFGHASTGGAGSDLVLVGDPKQAIYSFRGANVHTYVQAVESPGTLRCSLDTNWRSDPPVLRSVEHLLTGATFGDDRIGFVPVGWPEGHGDRALRRAPSAADDEAAGEPLPALSIRLVDGPSVVRARGGRLSVAAGDVDVYADLAVHVRNLLETATIPDEAAAGHRPLRPEDVAVLVASRFETTPMLRALRSLGIPAVITRGDDVLESLASKHWHLLLEAVARPTDRRRARAFALSWFGGRDATWLAGAGDDELIALHEQLHDWGRVLAERGPASFIDHVWTETQVVGRVLAHEDGDRELTDLDHIAELLVVASGRRSTPIALLDLFTSLAGGTDDGDAEGDLAARRVESEASAVQIMTSYVSKGLEFPVVCCPTLWRPRGVKPDRNVWWDESIGKRVIDVATEARWGGDEAVAHRAALAKREAIGTNLRLLYVALTRARHHTAVWWLPVQGASDTGLGRVLFARDEAGRIDPRLFTAEKVDIRFGEEAVAGLAPLVEAGGGTIEVALVDARDPAERRWRAPVPSRQPELQVAVLDRELPRGTRRWSFTAITASAGGHAPTIDPTDDSIGDAGAADEPDGVGEPEGSGEPGGRPAAGASEAGPTPHPGGPGAEGVPAGERSGAVPLSDVAGGAGFGSLVHQVLEEIDFASDTLEDDIASAVVRARARNPWAVDEELLTSGLLAAIETPLGPLFARRPLRALARHDRLDELEFDLTLGASGTPPTATQVGALVHAHLTDDDPLRTWAAGLADGAFDVTLAGHLTGSIDLVARIRREGEPDRFVVCDYKTNRIAPAGTPATERHYHPDLLTAEMAHAHYPLQALLYTVAVHRYLRWRLKGYRPDVHLGGTGYLFVRGLAGPATPTVDGVPHGVFEWHPPTLLVEELSDLLDGRTSRRRVPA